MSTAIPTTLDHEQRSEAFTRALALEEGLVKLEALKAACLAALERQAEAMRQEHARLMRAATTGANPEAPEQQALPLELAPAQAPAAEASPGKDEPKPPEPPKGKGRNRPRKPASEKGEKRAGAASSARSATVAQAAVSAEPMPEDALPAPRVPCCECSHSVADHKDGTGRCSGKTKGRPCGCKSFMAVAVALPGAPGWKVRLFKGQLSTGKGGDRAYSLMREGEEGKATLPLWWVPTYGLAFQDGKAVSCVFSYLGMRATTLSYEKSPAWNWVPREVLRALAEYMGATWPEPREEPAASEAPQAEHAPASKDDTPCECDGCTETFKTSELQPVGNGFYCATCKAEADEQDGEVNEAAPARVMLNDKLRRAENQRTTPLPAPAWAKSLDASSLLDAMRGPRDPSLEWTDKLEVSGTQSACDVCGEASIDETPSRARLDFERRHKPRRGKTWDASKDPKAGGILFSRWLCQGCAMPETLAEERRAILSRLAEPLPVPSGTGTNYELLSRKGVTWAFVLGHVHGQEIDILVHKKPRSGPLQTFPAARWSLEIEGWTSSAPPEEVPGEVVKLLVKALRAEDSPAREAIQRAGSQEQTPADHRLDEAPTGTSTWRVELPERYKGNAIIRLWLVNTTTGERRPASWWSGVSALRRGHHVAGKLEGEALEAHLELDRWWAEHADSVVLPLAGDCRDGKVPGLKVYEPEALGAGPHRYALSNGWTLETWEGEGEEAEATAHFTRPTERSDVWERFGPFVLTTQGQLTTANTEAAEWSAENEVVVREAESFVARGFVFELREAVAS